MTETSSTFAACDQVTPDFVLWRAFGGFAIEMRAKILVIVGLLLVGSGFAVYANGRANQEREQAVLDERWNMIQREAARRRILPGEERPGPAPLRGKYWIIGLLGSGVALSLGGAVTFLAGGNR